MDLHPVYVTPEAEHWFRTQLAALGPIKPVETYIGRNVPTRLGSWFLLNRAVMLLEYRVMHGPALDERERRARDVADVAVSYKLPREELRYVAHLVATGEPEQLVALHHEITGTFMVNLPYEFTADYLDQFLPEEEEEEEEELPPVPARTPGLYRRSKGIPFI